MTLNVNAKNLERMRKAVDNDMELKVEEKPNVVVRDHTTDGGNGHVVNLERTDCTCEDFEYNCQNGEFCKHIWYATFKRAGMV